LRFELLEGRKLLAAIMELADPAASRLTLDRVDQSTSTLLVQFRPEATAADRAVAQVPGTHLDAPWSLVPDWWRVEIDPTASIEQVRAALKANPHVLFVEPDYRVTLNLIPNDTSFAQQWSLNNTGQTGGTPDADIDAAEAWDVTTGNDAIIVAVIDTGVDYTHPDLAANIWINSDEIPGNNVDDDANGYVDDVHGYNFVSASGDPLDDHFHGTHVAGTIGAIGNNNRGVAGVAWNVQIMALKFLDAGGGGYISDAISALNYAVANGAQISNNSWGGGDYSQAFVNALQAAANAGHIFVAAAGNDSNNNDQYPAYPASYEVENVVAVAATDHNDDLAWFSNFGPATVDLGAPGDNILSTFPTYLTDAMSNYGLPINYGAISGTSMATPHVAGALALIRGQHLDWTFDQAIGQLVATTDDTSGLAGLTASGRLNAAAAVGNPVPDTSGPRVIAADPSGATTGPVSSVRLRFSEPIDPATFDTFDIAEFSGPGGAIAVSDVIPVAGTSNRQFDVTFATQSAEGDYTLVIGPEIADRAGNPDEPGQRRSFRRAHGRSVPRRVFHCGHDHYPLDRRPGPHLRPDRHRFLPVCAGRCDDRRPERTTQHHAHLRRRPGNLSDFAQRQLHVLVLLLRRVGRQLPGHDFRRRSRDADLGRHAAVYRLVSAGHAAGGV
jgi:subtilisin family serine protease